MRTINYESDFKIIEGFNDESSILAAPFKFTYYTKVSRGVYVAEYNGSEYVNCIPTEDGKVIVPFDSPKLGMGVLMVKREFFLTDSDYKDGICNLVSVESTGITLDKGATDDLGVIEVEIEPFYHLVEVLDGSVTTEKIKDGAVTMAKLGSDVKKALKDAEIADGSITEDKLSEEVRLKLNQGGGGGEKGENGKSAYEIWLEQGNKGSEQDFLDSLKGEKGEQGIQGEKGDKMTYDDLSEEEKNDLASRVEVEVPTKTSELTNDSGYVTATKVVEQSASTANIQPNVLNVWGEVESLDITLAEPTDNTIVNEYMAQFTSGATATTLTLPNTIKWMAAPNIQPNKTYQLSIINNLGVIGEFSHE